MVMIRISKAHNLGRDLGSSSRLSALSFKVFGERKRRLREGTLAETGGDMLQNTWRGRIENEGNGTLGNPKLWATCLKMSSWCHQNSKADKISHFREDASSA